MTDNSAAASEQRDVPYLRLEFDHVALVLRALPELSLKLLETKSRYEYRWWGNDLFWFSFDGIILPLQNEQPLQVTDQNGEPSTIEGLILRHERKKLLETPLMLDVIERKWRSFARDLYTARIVKFSAMLASVFVASVLHSSTLTLPLALTLRLTLTLTLTEYAGQWENDKRSGAGKFTFACGDVYEGNWKENMYHGYGKYSSSDTDEYEGQWVKDRMSGHGKFFYRELGDVYEGDWENGFREGFGKYIDPAGNVAYEGDWVAGQPTNT